MRCSIRFCCITSVGIGFLWLFRTLTAPQEIEEDQSMMATKAQVATLLSLWELGGWCGPANFFEGTCTFHQRAGGSKGSGGMDPAGPIRPQRSHISPIFVKIRKKADTSVPRVLWPVVSPRMGQPRSGESSALHCSLEKLVGNHSGLNPALFMKGGPCCSSADAPGKNLQEREGSGATNRLAEPHLQIFGKTPAEKKE